MQKLSADIIYPISSAPIKEGVLIIDDNGKILEINDRQNHPDAEILAGILCPGFVNTHCHIELSHLKGKVAEHTGLLDFVKPVMQMREATIATIQNAMRDAMNTMLENGIVAVGDISNKTDSIAVKQQSKLYTKTFIELIGFNPEKATSILERGQVLQNTFTEAGLQSVLVPHASYSISAKLLQLIANKALKEHETISIHMQETADEDDFFLSGSGSMMQLFKDLNIDISHFKATKLSAVQSILENIDCKNKTILVHNTFTKGNQIAWVAKHFPNNYWCLCPNANLYIENQLPPIEDFIAHKDKVCLGTDSFASNYQLSILEEIKTIAKHFPDITLGILLQWATLNGAKALGFEDRLGSFEIGKEPGIVLIAGNHINSFVIKKIK